MMKKQSIRLAFAFETRSPHTRRQLWWHQQKQQPGKQHRIHHPGRLPCHHACCCNRKGVHHLEAIPQRIPHRQPVHHGSRSLTVVHMSFWRDRLESTRGTRQAIAATIGNISLVPNYWKHLLSYYFIVGTCQLRWSRVVIFNGCFPFPPVHLRWDHPLERGFFHIWR